MNRYTITKRLNKTEFLQKEILGELMKYIPEPPYEYYNYPAYGLQIPPNPPQSAKDSLF